MLKRSVCIAVANSPGTPHFTESYPHGTGSVTGADNRVWSDGTNAYEYDNAGKLIRKTLAGTGELTECIWDKVNRLRSVMHEGGQRNVPWSETYSPTRSTANVDVRCCEESRCPRNPSRWESRPEWPIPGDVRTWWH